MPSVTYEDYPDAQPHHSVGRQPIDVGNPSRSLRARGAEARRATGRDRSRARLRWRARPISISRRGPAPMWRWRSRSIAISSRSDLADAEFLAEHTQRRRSASRTGGGVDIRARRRDVRRPRSRAAAARRGLREHVTGRHPMRLGPRAESQRRQRSDVDSRAAGGRRKVRRAGRRLLDEQLGRVEHHASVARAASRTRASST